MKFEHLQKRKRKNKDQLILTGLFLLIGGFFALNGISVTNNLRNELDEETLKNAKEEIETKTDSILNANQHKK
jgi:ABC-type lipoprotein release transport system permease subunit